MPPGEAPGGCLPFLETTFLDDVGVMHDHAQRARKRPRLGRRLPRALRPGGAEGAWAADAAVVRGA